MSKSVVQVHLAVPATARGTVNTYFWAGPKFGLAEVPQGIMVTMLGSGTDVLIPWGNIANVVYGPMSAEAVKAVTPRVTGKPSI